MMVSNVRGEFRNVSGTVRGDEKDPMHAQVEATIDTTSIDTRNEKRDGHLKSPDFLDAERYPTMTFRSKRIEKTDNGRYRVTGDLALHGVTREVTLDVDGPTAPVKDRRTRWATSVPAPRLPRSSTAETSVSRGARRSTAAA